MNIDLNMEKETGTEEIKTIRNIVNTPFKKVVFVFQVLSWFLIVGSPFIGGAIGKILGSSMGVTGGIIFGVFIAGEILFYATLAFLGKELILVIKDKSKIWFKRFKKSKMNNG